MEDGSMEVLEEWKCRSMEITVLEILDFMGLDAVSLGLSLEP